MHTHTRQSWFEIFHYFCYAFSYQHHRRKYIYSFSHSLPLRLFRAAQMEFSNYHIEKYRYICFVYQAHLQRHIKLFIVELERMRENRRCVCILATAVKNSHLPSNTCTSVQLSHSHKQQAIGVWFRYIDEVMSRKRTANEFVDLQTNETLHWQSREEVKTEKETLTRKQVCKNRQRRHCNHGFSGSWLYRVQFFVFFLSSKSFRSFRLLFYCHSLCSSLFICICKNVALSPNVDEERQMNTNECVWLLVFVSFYNAFSGRLARSNDVYMLVEWCILLPVWTIFLMTENSSIHFDSIDRSWIV